MEKKISSYCVEANPIDNRNWVVSITRQRGEMEYYFEAKLSYPAAMRLYHSIKRVRDVRRVSGKQWKQYN